jgi:hypothetical protein
LAGKVACGNKVAGNEHHMIVAALHSKRRNCDGSLYLAGISLVKLTYKVYSSALGNDADFTSTDFDLIHSFLHSAAQAVAQIVIDVFCMQVKSAREATHLPSGNKHFSR